MTHELTQPVITQFIRVNPKTWNEQIALRAELYGFDAGSGQTSTVVGKYIKDGHRLLGISEQGREGGEKRVLEERRVREGRDRQVNGQEGE